MKGDSVEIDSKEILRKNFVWHTLHFMHSFISRTWLFWRYFATKKRDLYSNKYGNLKMILFDQGKNYVTINQIVFGNQ